VIVKGTFIALIDPTIKQGRMNRSQSDSALPCYSFGSEKPWQKISSDKWQDISDASTTVSGKDLSDNEHEVEEPQSFMPADVNCNVVYDTSMQQCMTYPYCDTWWMMSMSSDGSDPHAQMMWTPMPEGCNYMASEWPEQISTEYETTSTGATPGEWRTTVMIRNMPNNYTREMMLDLVDVMGFKGCYDFAYLPVDFKSQAGLGYAFINFVSTEEAQRCFECFEGFCDWIVPSEKVCTVTWGAPYQGLESHIERYQNSPVMHPSIQDEWKPVLFEHGLRIAFPPPTKPIKTPKIRQIQ